MKIVLEGLWGLGKSTIANHLKEQGFLYLHEPDHATSSANTSDIDRWYIRNFLKLWLAMSREKRGVVYERSLCSTLAYVETRDEDEHIAGKIFKELPREVYNDIDLCIILNCSTNDYQHRLVSLDDPRIRNLILNKPNFAVKYQKLLEKYCSLIFGDKKVKKVTTYKNHNFVSKEKIFTEIAKIISN